MNDFERELWQQVYIASCLQGSNGPEAAALAHNAVTQFRGYLEASPNGGTEEERLAMAREANR